VPEFAGNHSPPGAGLTAAHPSHLRKRFRSCCPVREGLFGLFFSWSCFHFSPPHNLDYPLRLTMGRGLIQFFQIVHPKTNSFSSDWYPAGKGILFLRSSPFLTEKVLFFSCQILVSWGLGGGFRLTCCFPLTAITFFQRTPVSWLAALFCSGNMGILFEVYVPREVSPTPPLREFLFGASPFPPRLRGGSHIPFFPGFVGGFRFYCPNPPSKLFCCFFSKFSLLFPRHKSYLFRGIILGPPKAGF